MTVKLKHYFTDNVTLRQSETNFISFKSQTLYQSPCKNSDLLVITTHSPKTVKVLLFQSQTCECLSKNDKRRLNSLLKYLTSHGYEFKGLKSSTARRIQ